MTLLARTLPLALLVSVLSVISGCNRFDPSSGSSTTLLPPTIGDGGVGVSSQVEIEYPLFGGLEELVAGDGVIDLRWTAATDNNDASPTIRYRVYVASSIGDQDFTNPALETAAGETTAQLTGLANGVTLHIVVRSVDLEDNEDPNRVGWFGTPNPIRFVGGPGAGGDGSSPTSAFASVGQAVGQTIGLGGVNLRVAGGSYPENVLLFPGMALYGGYSASFDFDDRDPTVHVTEFSSGFDVDLIVFQSGALPIVLDGCVVSGQPGNRSGVKAEDVPFLIGNSEIRDLPIHGVEILSDIAEADAVTGTVRGCAIVRCGAEGILIDALGDIVIDDNRIQDNGTEGIESKFLYAETDETTQIEITRNRIVGNGDEGVDLDFAELSETNPTLSQGSRIRVVLRANDIRRNRLAGVQLDIDFELEDGVDFEARVEDNQISANGEGGLRLDGDAPATFRVARNVITANRGPGIEIQGTADGPWCRIANARIVGNTGPGVLVEDHIGVEIRQTLLGLNRGGSVIAPRAFVDVSNCIVDRNGGPPLESTALRYTLLFDDPIPATAADGVLVADPLLENTPRIAAEVVAAGSANEAIIGDASAFIAGDTIELRDDGVPRTVGSVLPDRLTFTPPIDPPSIVGDVVFGFDGDSVREREGLLETSPAIDGGHPLETDRDGSRADLGPVGGDTPGNVGIETGLAREVVPTELDQVTPLPSLLTTSASWTLRFRRPIEPTLLAGITVSVDGAPALPSVLLGPSGDEVTLMLSPAPTPGQVISTEISPAAGTSTSGNDRQPHHHRFAHLFSDTALDADAGGGDPNGNLATAQSVPPPVVATGTIGSPGDRDHYRVDLDAGDRLVTELIAGRRGSPLVARLSIFRPDGTLLSTIVANPPFDPDPLLPTFIAPSTGAFIVRVEASDGTGSAAHAYELQLSAE